MPTETLLVNVARGPVVDTEALLSTLQRNQLGGAVLDVTDPEPLPEDHPLWGLDNVVVTPHNAGDTPEYFARCADILAENVRRLRNDDTELKNQV
jgi:phosphoglycerate dehydrogenase-like enzyme